MKNNNKKTFGTAMKFIFALFIVALGISAVAFTVVTFKIPLNMPMVTLTGALVYALMVFKEIQNVRAFNTQQKVLF